jgi:excisionase family DNA binding protein
MPNFFTVAQTAKSLNVSKLTVYRRTVTGEIPSTRIGRKVLIPAAFIEKLVTQAMSEVQLITDPKSVRV